MKNVIIVQEIEVRQMIYLLQNNEYFFSGIVLYVLFQRQIKNVLIINVLQL